MYDNGALRASEKIFSAELTPSEVLTYSSRLFVKSLGWILVIFVLFELPDILATRLLVDSAAVVRFTTSIAGALLVAIGQIILIYVVGNSILSERSSISSTFRFSISKLPVFYITQLMVSFFTGLLILLLIVPGVIYLVYWSFTAQMVVLEDLRFGAALYNSKEIVNGRWRKVFVYSLPFILLIALGIILTRFQFFSSHQNLTLAYDFLVFPFFIFQTVLFTVLFANLAAVPLEEDEGLDYEDEMATVEETQ